MTNQAGDYGCLDILIKDIIGNNIEQFSLNDKYALLGAVYKVRHIEGTIGVAKSLLINHYNNDLKDIDTQKYIADILLELLGNDNYISFCTQTFKAYEIEGMLYTLINAYKAIGHYDKALSTLDIWIEKNSSNQRMINKRNNLIKSIPVQ